MRTALCISGLPRRVKQGFITMKKYVIEPYNPDIFLHLWTHDIHKREAKLLPISNGEILAEQIDQVKELYFEHKVRQCVTVTPDPYFKLNWYKAAELEHETLRWVRHNSVSMFHGIHECNKLKQSVEQEEGFKYDMVVRARTDLSIKDPTFKLKLVPNTITIPTHPELNPGFLGYQDMIAYGPSAAMDYYCDLYTKFRELQKYTPVKRNKRPMNWGAEMMLGVWLDLGPWKINDPTIERSIAITWNEDD